MTEPSLGVVGDFPVRMPDSNKSGVNITYQTLSSISHTNIFRVLSGLKEITTGNEREEVIEWKRLKRR